MEHRHREQLHCETAQRETIEEFVEAVGRKKLSEHSGMSPQQIGNSINAQAFPSVRYWQIRRFCERLGRTVPDHLFKGYVPPEAASDAA
jgi:hypothetical protein